MKSAESSCKITLRVAIRSPRYREFEQHAINVATPGHPDYGHRLTRQSVQELLQPDSSTSSALRDWLYAENIIPESISEDANWLHLNTTIWQAENLLSTTFAHYHNSRHNHTLLRTLQYSVPSSLVDHILTIQPTTRFAIQRPQRMWRTFKHKLSSATHDKRRNSKPCNSTVTPDCLKFLYGLDQVSVAPHPNSTIGISGYLGQVPGYSDYRKFYRAYESSTALPGNYSIQVINGGPAQQSLGGDSIEASLDVSDPP